MLQIMIYNSLRSHKNKHLRLNYDMEKIKDKDKNKHLVKLSELSKSIVAKIQNMLDMQDLKLFKILYYKYKI
jgi:hypothetical protein